MNKAGELQGEKSEKTFKQEVVLAPNNPLGDLVNADKLVEHYEDIVIDNED